MTSAKRSLPSDDDTSNQPSEKRRQRSPDDRPCEDLTAIVLARFKYTHDTQSTREDFVMLCGYLCALLAWGWSLGNLTMDAFILEHDDYLEQMPAFEEQQYTSPTWSIPAYHQWFHLKDRKTHARPTTPLIIDEPVLRKIGEENPCVFWIAAMTLEFVQASRP